MSNFFLALTHSSLLPHLLMKATGSSLLGTSSPEWITSSGSLSVATISYSLTNCKRGKHKCTDQVSSIFKKKQTNKQKQWMKSHLIKCISWTELRWTHRILLPSTWPAAAAALPDAGRCTSSFRCRRARGQRRWWCYSLAASAQVWTASHCQSTPHWSPARGCLSLKQSVNGGK